MGIDDRLEYLEQFADAVMKGAYITPTALGPNTLSKTTIKAKSITGSMISVSNLEAVQTKTGNLSVDGNLTITTNGSLRSGKTSYSDISNAGYWLGLDAGVPKFRIGNVSHSKGLTWDGVDLVIKGTVTATSGAIGGWIIGSTDLTSDSGSTGIASSGSYRLWIGNGTPANAPFSVTSAGAIKATSGNIGNWTLDQFGLRAGSGSNERGIDIGPTSFYAGGSPASAKFKVTRDGIMSSSEGNFSGALNATSGNIAGNLILSGSLTTSANTGAGVFSTGKTTYSSTTPGYFLGYDAGQYKLNIGDSTKYMKWNGSTLTVSGRFEFGTGDYLENDIMHFEVGTTPGFGLIEFKNSTNAYDTYITATAGPSETLFFVTTSGVNTNYSGIIESVTNVTYSASRLYALHGGNNAFFEVYGSSLVPGNSGIHGNLADAAGVSRFSISNTIGQIVLGVTSNGGLIWQSTAAADPTGLGTKVGIPIYINGLLYYLAAYR